MFACWKCRLLFPAMSNSSSVRIENWLDQVSGVSQSRAGIQKRRAMSFSSRGISPSKRRRGEGSGSNQMASLASISELPDLTKPRSTSAALQSSSQARDIFNQHRLSTPAIIYEPHATGSLPEAVLSLGMRLTDGFGKRIILEGLKVLLKIKLIIVAQ